MATPDRLVFGIEDALGVSATLDLYTTAAGTETLSAIETSAQTVATELDPITDGQITYIEYVHRIPLPSSGIKTTPNATAEVERTGLFNFSQVGSVYKFGVDVPAIADSVLSGGKIDLTNTDVINWKNLLIAGAVAFDFVSKFANSLVALLDALISFRKHRRAENRRSYEIGS